MTIFHLPDLGEGLAEAEIHQWHVNVGDTVLVDQPLVSMETAKAVVEVPAPQAGTVSKRYGQAGDIIQTGAPLVAFNAETTPTPPEPSTVVGNLHSSTQSDNAPFIVGSPKPPLEERTPHRNIRQNNVFQTKPPNLGHQRRQLPPDDFELLKGTRRTMAMRMTAAHNEVVPVTLFDDADIHHFSAETDITVRLIQAIAKAVREEPALNAWYDAKSNSRRCHDTLSLGLAIDNGDDLYVPVIPEADKASEKELRSTIDKYKILSTQKQFPPDVFKNPTFTLSNFGNLAGRYATPIISPPTVAILAVGRYRDEVVAHGGEMVIHRILPLSLSFDHRAVTGAESARFLSSIIAGLTQQTP